MGVGDDIEMQVGGKTAIILMNVGTGRMGLCYAINQPGWAWRHCRLVGPQCREGQATEAAAAHRGAVPEAAQRQLARVEEAEAKVND